MLAYQEEYTMPVDWDFQRNLSLLLAGDLWAFPSQLSPLLPSVNAEAVDSFREKKKSFDPQAPKVAAETEEDWGPWEAGP